MPLRSEKSIWEQIARQLAERRSPDQGLGIWELIMPDPGGLWRDLHQETLLLSRGRESLWQQVTDETLILERAVVQNVWIEAQVALTHGAAGQPPDADVWQDIQDETLLVSRPEHSLWDLAKVRNIAHLKPVRTPGWALKKLTTAGGESYYVLKSLQRNVYLRLDERQVYVWNLLDGDHNVQDLATAFFLKYQRLSIDWLIGFLRQLQMKGFAIEEKYDLYRESQARLQQRTLGAWVKRVVSLLLRFNLWVEGIDDFFGALYRYGGWLLFTRLAQVLILLVSLAGLPAFFYVSQRGDLALLTGTASSTLGTGLLGLLVAEVFAVFAHEAAHGLTVKHYGRTVRRGGIGLYWGMLSFFVDTTDIWMEPRKPRLAVTWAGPYSGMFLGGVASIVLLMHPGVMLAGVAYQFATFCYGISLVNVNPLLKLDGYYLLMDWLEIPRLREQSLVFVRRQLWSKLRQRERLNRQERILAVFGSLALGWTGVAHFLMAKLYGTGLYGLILRVTTAR